MVMKKFINEPQNLVAELLEGLALAHPQKGPAGWQATSSRAPYPKRPAR